MHSCDLRDFAIKSSAPVRAVRPVHLQESLACRYLSVLSIKTIPASHFWNPVIRPESFSFS